MLLPSPASRLGSRTAGTIRRMAPTDTQKLPEGVELMVLDSSGNLRDDVGLEELPGYLSDEDALVWCDIVD